MGEIGFPRNEFLRDMRWWEIKSIIRGYNARHHHGWEQARLIAYNARFCMGSKDPIPPVNEWIKFPWERQTDEEGSPTGQPSLSEVEELRRLMAEENARAELTQDTKTPG